MRLSQPKGNLVIVGGAEDSEHSCDILRAFYEMAGGKKARIVVLTIATDHPEEVGARYRHAFRKLGAPKIDVIDVSKREDVDSQSWAEQLRSASGIFFTGGDQLHITALIGGTEMDYLLHKKYQEGVVLGGTSAGAAMMSNSMIIGGQSESNPKMECVRLGPGMEFLLGCIIDTHFSQRGRYGRLLAAIAHYPHDLGIGIDEDTAIIVRNSRFDVVGSGAVIVMDMGPTTYSNITELRSEENISLFDVKLHILSQGHSFDLESRRPFVTAQEPGAGQDPKKADREAYQKLVNTIKKGRSGKGKSGSPRRRKTAATAPAGTRSSSKGVRTSQISSKSRSGSADPPSAKRKSRA